jgi:hypothetical protein
MMPVVPPQLVMTTTEAMHSAHHFHRRLPLPLPLLLLKAS